MKDFSDPFAFAFYRVGCQGTPPHAKIRAMAELLVALRQQRAVAQGDQRFHRNRERREAPLVLMSKKEEPAFQIIKMNLIASQHQRRIR